MSALFHPYLCGRIAAEWLINMKNNKWNIIVYLHTILLLWALLFIGSLYIPDGGRTASALAIGNALFMFVNIPFAVVSLVLKAKGYFSVEYEKPIVVLSILNIIIGAIAWYVVVLLLHSPTLG